MAATRFVFFLIGFVTDFTSLAEFYFLRELGLDVASCYAAATLINSPWSLRPFWGYWSDRIGRRHAQLAVLFAAAFVCWMIVRETHDEYAAVAMLLLCEISAAAGLTIADAYVVKLTARGDDAAMPKHQRFRIVGRVAASFASGHLLDALGVERDALMLSFLIQGLIYLAAAPCAFFFLKEGTAYARVAQKEEGDEEEGGAPAPASPPWHVVQVMQLAWSDRSVRAMLICLLLFSSLPDTGSSLQYFVAGPLHVGPLTFATMDAVRGACEFMGTFVSPSTIRPRSAAVALVVVANAVAIPMVGIVTRSTAPWIDDGALLILSAAISAWVASAFSIVFAVRVSQIAPEGKESGIYSGIVSIPTLGQCVAVPATYALTRGFGIDHDSFADLPVFFTSTAALFGVASLFVPFVFAWCDRT